VGSGAAVGFQRWHSRDGGPAAGTSPGAGPAPSSSAGHHTAGSGAVPANWQTHRDPFGFSISVPKGWKRKVYGVDGALRQVDYSPDGGKHFVRVSIDTAPDFSDAYEHQKDLEQQLQRLVGYRRVTLKPNVYRDHKGSLWEYTWDALAKDPPYVAGPRHAIEETYYSRTGAEYAVYMSSPAGDWATADKQFKWILRSWQPDQS
jgi:hypothetical protein